MKKIKIALSIAMISLLGQTVKAQELGTFLEGGVRDANTLLQNYMEPMFIGMGYGINSGWYNTAKPHKLLGFDLTATVSLASVPDDAQFFTFNPDDYANIGLDPRSTTDQAPTLFGPNKRAVDVPFLAYNANGESVSISSPTGLGIEEQIPFNAVPAPMIQLGVGIIKNTDVKLRIIPKLELADGDFEFEMIGVGFMHDLKQWIPGLKQMPLDFSGFIGWNRISAKIFLDEFDRTQVVDFSTNGVTIQGLVSKKLAFLTLFGGVGVSTTTSKFEMRGTYETENAGTFTDPVDFDFSSTGPRINLGMRMKLLILTLHADYAIQKYNTLTVGAGISIR